MRNVSDKSFRENRNTLFMFCNFFFPSKIVPFLDNVEKYGKAGQATGDNIISAFALHAGYEGYRQTHW